ncbi:MAG: hypothetical protein M1825_001137 [Sarcosagium campestre]|nr:MAG: hypothetical protein M1825_001137 [Sarcosagium campestre]
MYTIDINGRKYRADAWTNVPSNINKSTSSKLHLQDHHPISITRQLIESRFPAPTYKYHNSLPAVVSVAQNFDSLGFPADHPGRNRTDTYYVNKYTVLRTHTSAHQADLFRANESPGYLVSADVYRRDAIDRSHYPIFHQMEGARMWDRTQVPSGDITRAVYKDLEESLDTHAVKIEDPNPTTHPERNPLQIEHHKAEEVEAIAAHLKRTLELLVIDIFSRAAAAAAAAATGAGGGTPSPPPSPLKIRWVEAYFPFTSPSWELEVFWDGEWLELLGCGIVKQTLPIAAGVPSQLGWAFGLGLERLAMLLFSIPDIRLFWSKDPRFLSQFVGLPNPNATLPRFVPFSKYPACYKDVAFWLPDPTSTPAANAAGGALSPATAPHTSVSFHENDVMEIVREVAGDVAEDVRLLDEFKHPKTGRRSLCYRVNYRSLERTLTTAEANAFHDGVREKLVERLGVELR